jgi:hypothetical protein
MSIFDLANKVLQIDPRVLRDWSINKPNQGNPFEQALKNAQRAKGEIVEALGLNEPDPNAVIEAGGPGHYFMDNGIYLGEIKQEATPRLRASSVFVFHRENASGNAGLQTYLKLLALGKAPERDDTKIADVIKNETGNSFVENRNLIAVQNRYSIDELLVVARIIVGEGGGDFPLHYAWAIANGFLIGNGVIEAPQPTTNFKERITYILQKGTPSENIERYNKFINGIRLDDNINYNQHLSIYNNPKALAQKKHFQKAFEAIFRQQFDPNSNPILMAYQWRGGKTLSDVVKDNDPSIYKGVWYTNVNKFELNGFYHVFFAFTRIEP